MPGCAKETTCRNCATNGGLLQAELRTDSSYGATCYARLRDLGSSVEECLATIDEVRVRYAVLRHQMVHRYS